MKMAASLRDSLFLRRVAETMIVRIVLLGVGLGTAVIVARVLGPRGNGLFHATLTLGLLGVQFGNLGLHASNTYFIARDPSRLPALLANTLAIVFLAGGGGAAILLGVFWIWPALAPVGGWLLVLGVVYIPVGLGQQLLQNLLLGLQAVRMYNVLELLAKTLGLGLIGLALLWGSALPTILFGAVLVGLGAGFVASFAALASRSRWRLAPSAGLLRGSVSYGLRAYGSNLFAILVLRADVLMVQYMLGSDSTGLYSISARMADLIFMLPVVVGMLLFPKLSSIRDPIERWRKGRTAAAVTGVVMAFGGGAAAFLAFPMVRLLFGDAYLPAVPAFLVLLPGIWFLSVNAILMNWFAASGMPAVAVYSPGIAFLANVAANLYFIPVWDIEGAAAASSLAYGLMFVTSLVYLLTPAGRKLRSQSSV